MTDVYDTAVTIKDTHFTSFTYGRNAQKNGKTAVWPTIPDNDEIDCVYFTWAVLHKVMSDDGKTPKSNQQKAIYVSNWETKTTNTAEETAAHLHSLVEEGHINIQGPVKAIANEGFGSIINIADIKKGDFVQWWRKTGNSNRWNSGHSVIAADDITTNSAGEYVLEVLGAHYTNTSNPNTPFEKTQNLTGFKVFAARYTGGGAAADAEAAQVTAETPPIPTISVQSRATDIATKLLTFYNTYAEMPITHNSSTINIRVAYHINSGTRLTNAINNRNANPVIKAFLANYNKNGVLVGKGSASDLQNVLQDAVAAGHISSLNEQKIREFQSSTIYSADPAKNLGYGVSCDCSGFVSLAYRNLIDTIPLELGKFPKKHSSYLWPGGKVLGHVFTQIAKPEDMKPGDAIAMNGHVRMVQSVDTTDPNYVIFHSIEITSKYSHPDYADGSGVMRRMWRYPKGGTFKIEGGKVKFKNKDGSVVNREEWYDSDSSWHSNTNKILGYTHYPPLYDATTTTSTSTSSINSNPKRAYYAVAGWDEEGAGLRAAKSWRDEVMAASSYDESSTYFPEPFVANSVESFRNHWSVMKDTDIIVKEVRIYLPPVDRWFAEDVPDGLQFCSSSGFEVMPKSDIANLNQLQWDAEGELQIIGDYTGSIPDSRPWCPAQILADNQQIYVLGEPDKVAFSAAENQYQSIDGWV